MSNDKFFSLIEEDNGWKRIRYEKPFNIMDPVHGKRISVKKGDFGGLIKNTVLPDVEIFISESSKLENCVVSGRYLFSYCSHIKESELSDCVFSECVVSNSKVNDSWVVSSSVTNSVLKDSHVIKYSDVLKGSVVYSEIVDSHLRDSQVESCALSEKSTIISSTLKEVIVSGASSVCCCNLECFDVCENSKVSSLTYFANNCYRKYKLASANILEQFDFAAFGDDFAYRTSELQNLWSMTNRKVNIKRSFDRFNLPQLDFFDFDPHVRELARIIALNSKRFYANKETFILNSKGNNNFHEWMSAYFYMAANFCLRQLYSDCNSMFNVFRNLIHLDIASKKVDSKNLLYAYKNCKLAIFDPITIRSFKETEFPVNTKNDYLVIVNP